MRDDSGEPLPDVGRSIDGFTQAEAAKLLEQPGHCYYTLVTYINLNTGEYYQEIENYHCIPPSGNGGDSGGTSGGGSTGPGFPPSSGQPGNIDPCSTFTDRLNNVDYVDLLGNVLGALKSSSNEIGYVFSIDPAKGSITAISSVGTPASVIVGYNNLSAVDGYIHTHTAADFSIFSIADLESIYTMYSTGYITDPSTFTAEVWTPTGVYALTISNPNAFLVVGSNMVADRRLWEDRYQITYGITNSSTPFAAQKALAQLLVNYNTRLTL